jgi:hypothetical protein
MVNTIVLAIATDGQLFAGLITDVIAPIQNQNSTKIKPVVYALDW